MHRIVVRFDGSLVLLSLVIAVAMGCLAFVFCRKAWSARGIRKGLWLAAAALITNAGMWSVDYVGFLSMNYPLILQVPAHNVVVAVAFGAVVSYLAYAWFARYHTQFFHAAVSGTLLACNGVATYLLILQSIRPDISVNTSIFELACMTVCLVISLTMAVHVLAMDGRRRSEYVRTFAAAVAFTVGVASVNYITDATNMYYTVDAFQDSLIDIPGVSGWVIAAALFTLALLLLTGEYVRRTVNRSRTAVEEEYRRTMQQQPGLTFKFEKVNGRFVHTFSAGKLSHKMRIDPAFAVGKTLDELFSDPAYVRKKEQYYEHAWNGKEVSYEGYVNGVHYLATLQPVRVNGQVVEVIASCVDITELQQARAQLANSEERYRLIPEHSSDLIRVMDKDAILEYVSPSHERILGYTEEELVGRPPAVFIHPDDAHVVNQEFLRMEQERGEVTVSYRCVHKDGGILWFESRAMPVFTADGELANVVIVSRDITERRSAEEALRRTEKMLMAGQLAAGVAHEIRNPLTVIQGFVDLLRYENDEQAGRYLNIIRSEVEQIDVVIKEFLLLAKPEYKAKGPVDIGQLIRDVVVLMMPQANLKNVRVKLSHDQSHRVVLASESHIKQVFVNLLKNAVEASRDGSEIWVRIEEENDMVTVSIQDEGHGIGEDMLGRLGEPFYTMKDRGTGLGLMVSFQIVRHHGGDLVFQSALGKGTTARVQLPMFVAEVLGPT